MIPILYRKITIIVVLFMALTKIAQAAPIVTDLRCEYITQPLAVENPKPNLSWRLESTASRGMAQSAYQIQVWDGEKTLWDSGKVISSQSVNVPYQGTALTSGQMLAWRVKVWDSTDTASEWSDTHFWTMGFLSEADWEGSSWIGTGESFVLKGPGWWDPEDNTIPDPWFRKNIQLSKKPETAFARIATVGYHELYVNGQRVSDAVLMPNVADNSQRARYVAYDITPYLIQGTNCLALWVGNSWSIFDEYETTDKPRAGLVRGHFTVQLPDAAEPTIFGTNATWRTAPSPYTQMGIWWFMHYGGEKYDARKENPDWNKATFNDSAWAAAKTYTPDLKLTPDIIEPNRKLTRVQGVSVTSLAGGAYRVDMGVNVAGMAEFQIEGQTGQEVSFFMSEASDKEVTHDMRGVYIFGVNGIATYRNHFNYTTARWITVRGLNYKPDPQDFVIWQVRNDLRRSKTFTSSKDLFNRIHDTAIWTLENLSLGGYIVDCPQRERMGYGGDGHATARIMLDNFHSGAFYRKWMQDWRDVQQEDGHVWYTAPTYWGGGGPAWSGIVVTLPWQVYLQYGDKHILQENYDTMKRWLAYMESKSDGNIVRPWGGQWDFLGDWLWPGASGTNSNTQETLFFNNCYWIYALKTTAKIARILGKEADAQAYENRAQVVRETIHNHFYKPATASYVNGQQQYMAAALLVQLPPDDLWPAVWATFESDIMTRKYFNAGITGGFFVMEALLANDRADLIALMTDRETYPGFGDMLKRGATSIWESWNGSGSLMHSSYLWIDGLFSQGIAGLRRDEAAPGWKHFFAKPGINTRVSSAKLTLDTAYGPITSDWKVENNKLTWKLIVPPNTTATVFLPTSNGAECKEGQSLLLSTSVSGLTQVTDEGNQLRLLAAPGEYEFTSPLVGTATAEPSTFAATMEKALGPLSPQSLRAPNTDTDKDGLPNLYEFALGSDPLTWNSPDSGLFIYTTKTGDKFEVTLSYDRPTSIKGVRYILESSTETAPNEWTELPGHTAQIHSIENGAKERVVQTIDFSGNPSDTWFRLKIKEE